MTNKMILDNINISNINHMLCCKRQQGDRSTNKTKSQKERKTKHT